MAGISHCEPYATRVTTLLYFRTNREIAASRRCPIRSLIHLACYNSAVMSTLRLQPLLNRQTHDFTTVILGWCMTVSFLLVYCLGHGALTAEPLLPLASFRWSLIHGTSVIMLLVAISHGSQKSRLYSGLMGLLAALTSQSLLSVLLTLDWQQLIAVHSYTSIFLTGLLTAIMSRKASRVRTDTTFNVDIHGLVRTVTASQIIAAHAHRNYIELELDLPNHESATALIRMPLKALLTKTDDQLIQVHRSHLVNPAFISRSNRDARGKLRLHLNNGSSVPVSDHQRTRLKRLLIRP